MPLLHRSIRVILLPLVLCACAASAQDAGRVGIWGLESQRLSGADTARVTGAQGFSEVSVLVTIGTDGRVRDATVDENREKLPTGPALAAARASTFKPQVFDGHPVEVVGTLRIQYLPPEIPPDTRIAFPDASPQDTEIVLERSACYGTCPDYRVSVSGDGRVRFSTRDNPFAEEVGEIHRQFNGTNVLWAGVHEAKIDAAVVTKLVDRFRNAHFMGLKPEYVASITDNPTYRLTLKRGTVTKSVTDYVGKSVGMPAVVTELEKAVDEAADTARWVRGTVGTVALLKAQNFDFRSRDAADLMRSALTLNTFDPTSDVRAFFNAVLDEHPDLDAIVPERRRPEYAVVKGAPGAPPAPPLTLGGVIAQFAIASGDEALFERMARAGQVAKLGKARLDEAFTTDMGCSANIARALVKAGADPKAHGENGNALHRLREDYWACGKASSETRVAMARALIEVGVPLEARDSIGWTPLMGCDDPEIVKLLVAVGADKEAHDEDGTTPVLSVSDDRAAITLLRAGANGHAKDRDGNLRDQARKYHWPATLAWLDVHNIR